MIAKKLRPGVPYGSFHLVQNLAVWNMQRLNFESSTMFVMITAITPSGKTPRRDELIAWPAGESYSIQLVC